MRSVAALQALLPLLLACAPVPPAAAAPEPARAPSAYVVRVTTGDREGVEVDWAIFPDESWPLEGQRDRTPFQLELPAGRVAAVVRPTRRGGTLEVTILRREADGTLLRMGTTGRLPIAMVVADRRSTPPVVVGPEVLASPDTAP